MNNIFLQIFWFSFGFIYFGLSLDINAVLMFALILFTTDITILMILIFIELSYFIYVN